MSEKKAAKSHDWELIEKHYRAGIITLRQLGEEFGLSHVAIQKRAKTYGWTRDLKAKVRQKAQELVTRIEVTKEVTKDKLVTEAKTIEVYGEKLAQIEITQREDVALAMDTLRAQLRELALLGDPQFKDRLVELGELMDKSGEDENGRRIVDKQNELYMYIIGLAGRIKMAKDVASGHGVYIPVQRKIFKLDDDADKAASELDTLLRQINAAAHQ